MSKYIIDVGEGYIRHGLERTLTIPVRINEHEDHWMDTRIPVTPYTEPDLEQVREEAYEDGYKTAKVQCNIQAEKDLREVGERHYHKGLSDAWEIVKELFSFTFDEQATIFKTTSVRDIVRKYSAFKAIEKIRAYEQTQKEQEKIKVGDEVIARSGETIIVTHRLEDDDLGWLDGIGLDGRVYSLLENNCTKTGKHYSEMAVVLEKMRGE